MPELRFRKYLIVAFAIALFVSAALWAGIFFAIMNSRVWVGLQTIMGYGTMASFENNMGNWVAVQVVFYAILAFFGLTMASWILKDRAIVEDLYEENMQLRKEIDEIKRKTEEHNWK